jgi:hypothetical protein
LKYIPRWLHIGLLTVGLAFSAGPAQGQSDAPLVIEGGTLIDGNGGEPLENALIIIEGNKIRAVGNKGNLQFPDNSRVIEADGKFILPGLMDAHIHYQDWMTELVLTHGVTGVFEIGGGGEWGVAQRDAIARGIITGPRLYIAVGSLAGGRISMLMGRRPEDMRLSSRMVAVDAQEARDIARRFIDAGADMIKVHRGPTVDVYRAAAQEAHRVGLPLVAQPLGPTVYAREAILAGADGLEHAAGVHISIVKSPEKWRDFGQVEAHSLDPTPFIDMDEQKAAELIQLMVERDVWLEPDLIAEGRGFHKSRDQFELQGYRLLNHPELGYIPKERRFRLLDKFKEFDNLDRPAWERRNLGYQNMVRFMRMFAAAGGVILAGTDASSWAIPGLAVHQEMQILVEEVGLTPMQAILSATRNVAHGFRVLERVGTIEPDKYADLIILGQDPLADIRNTMAIDEVIMDGKIVERGYHRWYKNPLPRREPDGQRWLSGLKTINWRTTAFGQPTPGIEYVSPLVVTEGSPTLTLTVHGLNFTDRSAVEFNGMPVPVKLVSDKELHVIIAKELLVSVGAFPITVRNPDPLQDEKFGGLSNRAYLLVRYR